MKRLALVVCALMLVAPVFSAADVTGKWSGTFISTRPDGTLKEEKILMDLTQKGADLTGSAGPTADQQFPIRNGKVDGNKVTLELESKGAVLAFTLTLVDGHLKGECNAEFEGQKVMKAVIDVQRKTN